MKKFVIFLAAALMQTLLIYGGEPYKTGDVISDISLKNIKGEMVSLSQFNDAKGFIVGPEMSIAEHLQYLCPDKRFYCLSKKLLCPNMKITTLMDVYNCVLGAGGEEINLDDTTIHDARKCIDEMIRLG